jgi:predicted deacylase
VIRGEEDGPVLGLTSSVHGQEYYHNRIIRKIINEIESNKLSGTVLAIPVANPPAFAHKTRLTPYPPEETEDFANLNRVFPGRRLTPLFGSMEHTDISLTMKMASVITSEFVEKCTHIIDFHGHMQGGSLKKMLYNNYDPKSKELARFFGLGIIHDPITGDEEKGTFMPLTSYAGKLGIPAIVPEIGGGGHGEIFEKKCEEIGVQGIRNILGYLGMTNDEVKLPEKQFYFQKAPHIRAKNAGYLVSYMEADDVGIGKPTREVDKGEVLGTIYDPYTLKELEQLKSPVDGLLYMCLVSGLIEAQGYGIAVADYEDSKWIE